jgi:hypothetical protein
MEADMNQTIDFKKIEGLVYTGRDRGERLREVFGLDRADEANEPVEVKIPDDAYTISSSFFLGLFGPSVVKAGTKERFYQRYHFTSPEFLREAVDGYVMRALQNRNLFG